MDYILQLGDPLPADGKIYQTKTEGDGRNIKYSIRVGGWPLDIIQQLQELFAEEGHFQIDEMSGEVMVVKPLTRRGEHIVSWKGQLAGADLLLLHLLFFSDFVFLLLLSVATCPPGRHRHP